MQLLTEANRIVIMICMKLRPYLLSLQMDERIRFALRCGTTYNHLRNVAYGQKPCAEELAVAVEKESGGIVSVAELHAEFADLLRAAGYVRTPTPDPSQRLKEAA